jgi:hypothetical protein
MAKLIIILAAVPVVLARFVFVGHIVLLILDRQPPTAARPRPFPYSSFRKVLGPKKKLAEVFFCFLLSWFMVHINEQEFRQRH